VFELTGIKQTRVAIDEYIVAEMQVTMAPPHQSGALASDQQRLHAFERLTRCVGQIVQRLQRKQFRLSRKFCLVLRNNFGERIGEMRMRNRWSRAMRCSHRQTECIGERLADLTGIGQIIQRLALIEAPHLDSPFDRFALAADREAAIESAGDGHYPKIDRGRKSAIDCNLGFASYPAFLQRGEIEERKAHRAFDLERSLSRQEDQSGVSVDTLDRRAA